MRRPSPRRRDGFTLVELLIVIVIIGILVALLIPAIAAGVRKANEARVSAEINSFAGALEDFKTQFGDYPPSRIMLSEYQSPSSSDMNLPLSSFSSWIYNGNVSAMPSYLFGLDANGSNYQDLTVGQLWERSRRYMRKFFPKAAPANMGGSPPFWHDYNGDGRPTPGFVYLQGHECLVFFLGGIPNPSGTTYGVSGFDRNPVRPFTSPLLSPPAAANIASENRTTPYYEFKGDRLIDEDLDGFPGYMDTLNTGTSARPFVYFSAYGNNRYDPNDANFDADEPQNTLTVIGRTFRVNVAGSNAPTFSIAPNPYTSNDPVAAASKANFLNGTSYQIISAGADGNYGIGGTYTTDTQGTRLPVPSGAPSDLRVREQDNLTNFSATRLD